MESGVRDRSVRKAANFAIQSMNFNLASASSNVAGVEQDVFIAPVAGVVVAIQGYAVSRVATAQWEIRKNGTTLSLQSALVTASSGAIDTATLVTTGPGYVNIPAGSDSTVTPSGGLVNPNNAPTFAVGDRLSLYITTNGTGTFTQLSVCMAYRPFLGSAERTQAGLFN